jgi:hypothetical protein
MSNREEIVDGVLVTKGHIEVSETERDAYTYGERDAEREVQNERYRERHTGRGMWLVLRRGC